MHLRLSLEQQEGIVHVDDPLADSKKGDVSPCQFLLPFQLCHISLSLHATTVKHGLNDVDPNPVLVLFQSSEVQSGGRQGVPHLLWPCRHVALIGALGRSADLREPSLLDVADGELRGLPDEFVLSDERIILLRHAYALLQALAPSRRHRQQQKQ